MNTEKNQRRPIIDPLIMALKSRRVIIAICALLVGSVTMLVPQLEAVRAELLMLLITIALAVIGGYSIEDAAHAARGRDTSLDNADVQQLIRETIERVMDETMPSTK
jgi:hypothetical protein